MARTKSLATLILQHSDDRSYKLTSNKIPQIYNILNNSGFTAIEFSKTTPYWTCIGIKK